MKIYHKIILYSLTIMILPLTILSVLFFTQAQRIVEGELIATYDKMVKQNLNNITHRASYHLDLMERLASNKLLHDVLTHAEVIDSAYLDLGSKLTQQIDSLVNKDAKEEIHLISAYSSRPKPPLVSHYIGFLDEIMGETWFEDILRTNHTRDCVLTKTRGLRKECISIVSPIFSFEKGSFLEPLGILEIDILLSAFFHNALLDRKEEAETGICVFSSDGKLLFSQPCGSHDADSIWNLISSQQATGNSNHVIRFQKSGFLVLPAFQEFEFRYAFLFPLKEFRRKITDVSAIILVSFVALVVLFSLLTLMLTKPYTNRIRTLIGKIQSIQNGHLKIRSAIQGNDEISIIDRHFNEMVVRLRELINKNYEQKLEMRDAQLRALQAQINPHFLYNTLEMINSIASVHDCEDICIICERLGKILRYNLISDGTGSLTSLRDEVENVRSFLILQELRYHGGFSAQCDIAYEALDVKVPRFILQPIVENAVKHGFEEFFSERSLRISAHLENGKMAMSVTDNGKGMTEKQVKELSAFIAEEEGERQNINLTREHIGLKNVRARLQYTYGEKYTLSIKSKPHEGTEVTIVLPAETAK